MCWNKEVSIVTYIIVIVLVIILYRRNKGSDRHIAIFSAVFVTIQLLEFFAWLSLEQENRKLNDLVTRLILIVLWAQPLVNTVMASTNSKSVVLIVGILIFTFLFFHSIKMASNLGEFSTEKGPNCHLTWARTVDGEKKFSGDGGFMSDIKFGGVIYILGLFIPLLFIKPLSRGIKLATIGVIMIVASRVLSSRREYSSWWCWAAGVFTLAAIFIQK